MGYDQRSDQNYPGLFVIASCQMPPDPYIDRLVTPVKLVPDEEITDENYHCAYDGLTLYQGPWSGDNPTKPGITVGIGEILRIVSIDHWIVGDHEPSVYVVQTLDASHEGIAFSDQVRFLTPMEELALVAGEDD